MIRMDLMEKTAIHEITEKAGCFSVVEYKKDISVSADSAAAAYYASKMNVRKRQLVAELAGNGIIMQAGAMQMVLGNVEMKTEVSGTRDFVKKLVSSRLTGETTVKPHYYGNGTVVLEPSYRHILLEDVSNWGDGMVIEDGSFLACEDTVTMGIVSRSSVTAAVAGGEGIFNTCLSGKGVVALEARAPREELVLVELEDDVLRIDGSNAIAWSSGLSFTVENATKGLTGSFLSGEGFVNVYRGTGRVLVAVVS